MILADIPLWLTISIDLLLVVQVVVSILLVGIVMMQRPKQEGLGAAFGSGMTDQMFGARTTSVLQKGTVYLGVAFFSVALLLAILIGQRSQITKAALLANKPAAVQGAKPSAPPVAPPAAPAAPAAPASTPAPVETETPAAPAAPVQPEGTAAPAAPAAPAGGQ